MHYSAFIAIMMAIYTRYIYIFYLHCEYLHMQYKEKQKSMTNQIFARLKLAKPI